MYDFSKVRMSDIVRMGIDIRALGTNCRYMEESVDKLVHYLFDNFVDYATGEKQCVLVRFFKTCDNAELPGSLRAFVNNYLPGTSSADVFKCLVLLATVGIVPEWNSRYTSKRHQAIPLPSRDAVERIPMIKNLIRQMGLDIETVIRPDPALPMDWAKLSFNVFHVENVSGSPFIPAQEDFVKPYGIKSVLGFGGVLPSGNIFAVILFTRVPIRSDIAGLFNTVALNVKVLILPFVNNVFA